MHQMEESSIKIVTIKEKGDIYMVKGTSDDSDRREEYQNLACLICWSKH